MLAYQALFNRFYIGFIVKVKKILESICVNCGKLKADTVSVPMTLLEHFLGALSILRVENPEPASSCIVSVDARSLAALAPDKDPYMSSAVGVRVRGEKESWARLYGPNAALIFGKARCLSLCRSFARLRPYFARSLFHLSLVFHLWRSYLCNGSLTGNLHIFHLGRSPTQPSP